MATAEEALLPMCGAQHSSSPATGLTFAAVGTRFVLRRDLA
jgi:hypothetical protein